MYLSLDGQLRLSLFTSESPFPIHFPIFPYGFPHKPLAMALATGSAGEPSRPSLASVEFSARCHGEQLLPGDGNAMLGEQRSSREVKTSTWTTGELPIYGYIYIYVYIYVYDIYIYTYDTHTHIYIYAIYIYAIYIYILYIHIHIDMIHIYI